LTEFFRNCPECGRRFHIKLVGKELVGSKQEKLENKEVGAPNRGLAYGASMPYMTLREGPPTIIDTEEFRFAYKCGHCGHEWSERRTEHHKES
jgi:DNA-directed RNA polymerase subunit RPC12/RpoP